MATDETPRSKANDAADNFDAEIVERDEDRVEDDQAEQQDLNQGMDTGTHDSKRFGVRWGPSYRKHVKPAEPKKTDDDTKGS